MRFIGQYLQWLLSCKKYFKYYLIINKFININRIYVPNTNVELIFSIVAIFLTTGVFGYTLNLIGVIITDITKKSKEYNN